MNGWWRVAPRRSLGSGPGQCPPHKQSFPVWNDYPELCLAATLGGNTAHTLSRCHTWYALFRTHHLHCVTQPVTVMAFITTMWFHSELDAWRFTCWLFVLCPCVRLSVSFYWLGVYQSVAQQWKMENQSNISCEGHPLIPRSTSSPGSGGLPGGGHRCQAGTPTPHWNITRR